MLFLEDGDREKFLEILEDYYDRYGILIHSYVLMDNHYHLILETPKGNLLKVMHGINGRYTGYFNRKYGRVGHLFQGRYRGIIIDKDSYLIPLSRYVHLNPVRARVVERPEHYRWSSYRGYIGREKESEWIEYSWVLSQFGQERNGARRKYKKYTEETLKMKVEHPLEKLHGRVILGGEEFIDRVKEMFKGKVLNQEIIERRRLENHLTLDGVLKRISRGLRVDEDSIRSKGGGANTARKVAIYFLRSGIRVLVMSKLLGILGESITVQ
jgi:putative transposase